MLKRIFLFLATNLAVILFIFIALRLLNLEPYLNRLGINYQSFLIYTAAIGFFGALISLFVSKGLAIHAFNITIIKKPNTELDSWLIRTVQKIASQNKVAMPEVGIYDSSEPNAFATGWNKNNALVAISTGLLETTDRAELEGILGHELSHVANGDMVTLALLQGVINTFVIFYARLAAIFTAKILGRDTENNTGVIYYIVAISFGLAFGLLASIIVRWFSRHREFRADKASAQHLGKDTMVKSLQALQRLYKLAPEDDRAPAFNTMKISDHNAWFALFSSHPPLEKRIEAIENVVP